MKRGLGITVTSLLVVACVGPVRADEDKAVRAVIDKAIKAHGGADKLAKQKAITMKEKGTYYGMGDGVPYAATVSYQHPDKYRLEIEGVFIRVVNGDKGWTNMNGATEEMTKERLAEQKEELYASWVTTLVPLEKKGYTLSPMGDVKLEGKPAVGVKVSHKGHRDVSLFFDKKTGLLVKSEHQVKAEEQGGKEVNQEVFYSDYKEVDGIKVPMKVVIKRDGKKFVESEVTEIKFLDKADPSLFDKP